MTKSCAEQLLEWGYVYTTVEPRLTTTPFIRPPRYYGHILSNQKYKTLTHYFKDPVYVTTSLLRPGFYGPTVVVLTGFHCTLDCFRADTKSLSSVVWTATAQNWNKSIRHIEQRARVVGQLKGLGELNLSPHFWIFTSVSVDFSFCHYLFSSSMVWMPVHTATLKYGTEPFWYVTLYFQDWHSTASLQYRNHPQITFLMFEQKL